MLYIWEWYHNILISWSLQRNPYHHRVLEPVSRKLQAFQVKPNMRGLRGEEVWLVEVEGRQTILTHACIRLASGTRTSPQHSHCATTLPIPLLSTKIPLKSVCIWAREGKSEGLTCEGRLCSWGGRKANHCCPCPCNPDWRDKHSFTSLSLATQHLPYHHCMLKHLSEFSKHLITWCQI